MVLGLESQSVWEQSTKANHEIEPFAQAINSGRQLEMCFLRVALRLTGQGELNSDCQILLTKLELQPANAGRAPAGNSSNLIGLLQCSVR